jgi:hypothetical protein
MIWYAISPAKLRAAIFVPCPEGAATSQPRAPPWEPGNDLNRQSPVRAQQGNGSWPQSLVQNHRDVRLGWNARFGPFRAWIITEFNSQGVALGGRGNQRTASPEWAV